MLGDFSWSEGFGLSDMSLGVEMIYGVRLPQFQARGSWAHVLVHIVYRGLLCTRPRRTQHNMGN